MVLNSTNLKRFRDLKKLTQEEIGFKLGISQTTISEWEKKDSNVKLEHIINLSKILEVGIEDLIIENQSVININNQNNNKISNNSIVGFNVEAQLIDLQKDLITQLKNQLALLESEINRLKGEKD